MLRDLATSVLRLGSESIWLLGALQSARTLASLLERRRKKGREGGTRRQRERVRWSGRRGGRQGKETEARGSGENSHLQSLSALPAWGAGPQLCTFFSTRTFWSCSFTSTVVTSSSCFNCRQEWWMEEGKRERRLKGKRKKKKANKSCNLSSCFPT